MMNELSFLDSLFDNFDGVYGGNYRGSYVPKVDVKDWLKSAVKKISEQFLTLYKLYTFFLSIFYSILYNFRVFYKINEARNL